MLKWLKRLIKKYKQEEENAYSQQFEEVDGHYRYIAQDGSVIYFKKSVEE